MSELNPSVYLASVCLVNPIDVCLLLSTEFDQYLFEKIPNVLCQVRLRESDVFSDQPTTFLACLFLPISVVSNLLMSIRTELACLLASVF